MDNQVTIRDAAAQLGLPVATLTSWADQFIPGFAARDAYGRRRVSRRQCEALQAIHRLRLQGARDEAVTARVSEMLAGEAAPARLPAGAIITSGGDGRLLPGLAG